MTNPVPKFFVSFYYCIMFKEALNLLCLWELL